MEATNTRQIAPKCDCMDHKALTLYKNDDGTVDMLIDIDTHGKQIASTTFVHVCGIKYCPWCGKALN